MKKTLFILLVIAFFLPSNAQNYKFGKVSIEELKESSYPNDSTVNAAYLYKRRRTYTAYNSSSNKIELITKVHVRLKIYNKDGFDWATESLRLFGKEKVSGAKAITYNLVDGNIEETKLSKKDIFSEQIRKNIIEKKFTMPNLNEGVVVEWTYNIFSPYYTNIDDVTIQYGIPIKKYETKIELLEWFRFNKRQKGYYPFKISESSKSNRDLGTKDKVLLIQLNNVPAILEEPYVNNMDNYAAGLEIEVASLDAPRLGLFESYATSWEEIAKDIYNSSRFGGELKKTGHLKEDILLLKSQNSSMSEKVGSALQHVKSKIKWNNNTGEYPEKGLKTAYKEGSGNIGDINLTLVAVLRGLGLDANPVLMSTRSNGIPLFPTTKGINYVIVHVKTSQGHILLDASEKYSLPNVLPLRAVNWKGIVIKKDGGTSFVNLENTIVAKETINLTYKISDDNLVSGMNRVKYENLNAINYRNNKANFDEDDLIEKIEEANDDIEILNFRLTNKEDLVKPIVEMYTFEKEDGVEIIGNKMYIQPLLFNGFDENPFKLETREFPVDFGTPWHDKINVTVEIPEGYSVESLPKNVGFALREDLGKFVFSIKVVANKIQIMSSIEINRGVIAANYYVELKEFFKQIVSKQTEKIVLSKT